MILVLGDSSEILKIKKKERLKERKKIRNKE